MIGRDFLLKMNYRQIIGEAWLFTQENKRMIVWYAFIPSFLTTSFAVLYILYQFYALKSSAVFENWSESFTVVALKAIFDAARTNLTDVIPTVAVIVIFVILALMYFFLPPLTEGSMLQLIARKKNGQPVRIRDGLRYGFFSFLPLFSYSLVARTFSLFSLIGEILFVLRNLGPELLITLSPLMVLLFIVCIVFTLLFVFTENYIVIDNFGIKESMAKSASLVIKHWDTALMVSVVMLIIALRILLQILFVLAVPIALMLAIYFFAASTISAFNLFIGIGAGIIALFFASYLGAIVHVFTSSVWVFTFLKLTSEPEVSPRDTVEKAS